MDKYFKLADLIESAVNNDYSGSIDKKEVIDKNKIRLNKISTRVDFYESVSEYLRLFKDRHLPNNAVKPLALAMGSVKKPKKTPWFALK